MVEGAEVAVGDIVAERYRVDRILGQGAMGFVVAATHIELHQTRAIKFMLPEALADKEGVERFLREARAAAKLTSPHAVKVHDVARLPTGEPYMVMEYLEGTDLKRYLAEKRVLPVPEAISYILQACDALAEAHAAGIVHRDLKPANLFLAERPGSPPVLKVLDFGIAKVNDQHGSGSDGHLTATQAVIGSPLYMSPEQILSTRSVDARSDVWSLGVILYVLVTGMVPFRGDSTLAIFASVQRDDPVPPSMWMPSLPRKLEHIILSCLEKDPARRCPSARDLAAALKAFQAEPAVAQAAPVEVGGGTQLMKPASSREPVSRPSAPGAPQGYSQPAPQGYSQGHPHLTTQPMPRGSYPSSPGYSQPGSGGHYAQAGGYPMHPQAGYPGGAQGSYPPGGPGSYPQGGAPGYGAASSSNQHGAAPASYPHGPPQSYPQAGAQTNSPLTQPVEAAPRRRNRELLLVGGGFATALVIVGAFVLFSGGGNSKDSTTTAQGVTAAPAPSPTPAAADTAAAAPPSAAPSAADPAEPGASPTAPSAPPEPAANTNTPNNNKTPATSGGTAAAPKPKSPTSPAPTPTSPATQKPAPAPTPTTTTGAPLRKRHD